MITHISIQNFAIIKELNLDLHPGLNIITGETGAGKSIIIEAISMALGSRADTDYIRTGEEKSSVTMAVDTDDPRVFEMLGEIGAPKDNPVILSRELSNTSKNLCRINGTMVPLSFMSSLCRLLADIHGQYDHQKLLDPETHIDTLDMYGGESLAKLRIKAGEYYDTYIKASTELMNIRKGISDAKRQQELYRFELEDIESANITPGEDSELESRIRLMKNSEKIYQALSSAYECLFGSGDCASSIANAMASVQSVSEFSDDIKAIADTVSDAYYKLEDVNISLRKARDSVSFSQNELDEAIERSELLSSLKRKYGGSLESVLEYAQKAKDSILMSENSEERVRELESLITSSKEKYDEYASKLSSLRKETAVILSAAINKELAELNFSNADFSVSCEPSAASSKGSDKIEFLISANRGEALKPLYKIASGGELSRIMLAMKKIVGDLDGIPTMIFDEIDTGISGASAGIVGSKLHEIAENHQILCITHLPQIACLGDYHYKIEKTSDLISTRTTVVPLSDDEKTEEIARLLSGTQITDTARLRAKEMLNSGR